LSFRAISAAHQPEIAAYHALHKPRRNADVIYLNVRPDDVDVES
jgi:hypothetical protein